jgi:MOSC domain-containing protein YiiM
MTDMSELRAAVPGTGRITWIGVARAKRSPIESLREVRVEPGRGIVEDHHAGAGGKREVTLIQTEHFPVIAALVGRERVEPELLRRNLSITGINVYALRERRFRVGTAVLEGAGTCPPCTRIEENLGPGGFQAARGHAGICARVVEGGVLRVGDEVVDLGFAVGAGTGGALD